MWQYPYVNLFKHFGVGQWKKCSREGDVTATMVRYPSLVPRLVFSFRHGREVRAWVCYEARDSQRSSSVGHTIFMVVITIHCYRIGISRPQCIVSVAPSRLVTLFSCQRAPPNLWGSPAATSTLCSAPYHQNVL